MRVVFAGTPRIAVSFLEALMDSTHADVVGVVSQPDRRSGRGMKVQASPVKTVAVAHEMDCITPTSLRHNDEALGWLQSRQPDILVVVAFGMILPKSWLDTPKLAPLNVHASLLPRWRGAAPIERAILAGDKETGVCIMHMDEGLDTGAVYASRTIPIQGSDTADDIRQRVMDDGAKVLMETIVQMASATLQATPQPEQGITYASKIDKSDLNIEWNQSATGILQTVRAFAEKPGARARVQGKIVKILDAEVSSEPDVFLKPAQLMVLNQQALVGCGEGSILSLRRVQPEGKASMDAQAWCQGIQAGVSFDN